jgi:hypothetical protein
VPQLPSTLGVRVQTPKVTSIEPALTTDAVSGLWDQILQPTDLFNSWHRPLPILSFVSRYIIHGMPDAVLYLSYYCDNLLLDVLSLELHELG